MSIDQKLSLASRHLSDLEAIRLIAEHPDPATITDLDLSHNRLDLKTLDLAALLPNLRCLDLSANPLRQLPVGVARLDQLQHLRLEGCNLVSLPVQLGGLCSLRKLGLDRNRTLKWPPRDVVPPSAQLHLHGCAIAVSLHCRITAPLQHFHPTHHYTSTAIILPTPCPPRAWA